MRKPLLAALASAALMSGAPAFAAPVMSPPPQTPPQAPPANSSYSANAHVFLVSGTKQTEIQPSQAQVFLADKPHPGLLMPTNVTLHMIYFLPDAPASVAPAAAAFEVSIVGVPWADPAHITPVIIRLGSKNGHDHVFGSQASHTSVFTGANTADPLADDRVPATVEVIAKGRFRITPAQPLSSGEYGVALRDPDIKPVTYNSSQANSATDVSQQQMYQGYVWAFNVSGGQQ